MTHINIQSHHEYSGTNLEKLNAVFEQEGYRQKIWGTFRQWKQVGHSVIQGEKGVRLFKYTKPSGKDLTEVERKKLIHYFVVFNVQQTSRNKEKRK